MNEPLDSSAPATGGGRPARLGRPIRILFLDVDGVLADGGIHLGECGETKRFAARDGTASFLSRRVDLKLMLITFRDSEAVRRRASELATTRSPGWNSPLMIASMTYSLTWSPSTTRPRAPFSTAVPALIVASPLRPSSIGG